MRWYQTLCWLLFCIWYILSLQVQTNLINLDHYTFLSKPGPNWDCSVVTNTSTILMSGLSKSCFWLALIKALIVCNFASPCNTCKLLSIVLSCLSPLAVSHSLTQANLSSCKQQIWSEALNRPPKLDKQLAVLSFMSDHDTLLVVFVCLWDFTQIHFMHWVTAWLGGG